MAGSDKRQRKKENARAAREAREAARRREHRRRNFVRFGVGLLVVAAAIAVGAWLTSDNGDDSEAAATTTTLTTETTVPVEPVFCTPDPGGTLTAKVTTNFGEFTAVLDTARAPIGAQHFADLARIGFYNELTWHRAVPDFVIQGGDPKGDGTGGAGQAVVAEVPTDNYPEGSLAAAKGGDDAAGTFDSQFFVVTGTGGATLPNDYARFGCVTDGLDVAQKIEALAPGGDGPPTEPATIDKIEISESAPPTTTDSGSTTTVATDDANTTTTGSE